MLTKDDCVNASYRQNFYHQDLRDSRDNPLVCRVNGKCKTWKKNPEKFELPVKYGLKECFYITETNADKWCKTEEDAMLHPLRFDGDWNKYVELTSLRPTQFICSNCKKTCSIPSKVETCSTGYAVERKTKTLVCYECCAKQDEQWMKDYGKIVLYLSKVYLDKEQEQYTYQISNWPGSLKLKVAFWTEGRHNWGLTRYNVWFKGPDGYVWYGVTYGDDTQICHCKRTKRMKF